MNEIDVLVTPKPASRTTWMGGQGGERNEASCRLSTDRIEIRRKPVLILTCQLPEFKRWKMFPFFIVQVVEIDIQRNNVFTLETGKQDKKHIRQIEA